MSYRKERLSHFIREVVSEAIANRVSDPRVSHFTSVTRVELSPDRRFADVFVSVMGTEADSRRTMRGLESARGMIQTRLARQLQLRQCPILRFQLDLGVKAAIETIRQLKEVEQDLAGEGERQESEPEAGGTSGDSRSSSAEQASDDDESDRPSDG